MGDAGLAQLASASLRKGGWVILVGAAVGALDSKATPVVAEIDLGYGVIRLFDAGRSMERCFQVKEAAGTKKAGEVA